MDASVIFGAAGVLLTVGVNISMFIWSGAWGLSDKLSKMENRMMERIEAHRVSTTTEIEQQQNKVVQVERDLVQKIHSLETWARDAFVSNTLFTETFRRFEKVLDRIDRKIDHLQGRAPEPSPTE